MITFHKLPSQPSVHDVCVPFATFPSLIRWGCTVYDVIRSDECDVAAVSSDFSAGVPRAAAPSAGAVRPGRGVQQRKVPAGADHQQVQRLGPRVLRQGVRRHHGYVELSVLGLGKFGWKRHPSINNIPPFLQIEG